MAETPLDLGLGTTEAVADASWEWRFGYSHWGYHLCRAMLTVHDIRYQLHGPF